MKGFSVWNHGAALNGKTNENMLVIVGTVLSTKSVKLTKSMIVIEGTVDLSWNKSFDIAQHSTPLGTFVSHPEWQSTVYYVDYCTLRKIFPNTV